MLYAGTAATYGRGRAVVTATGMQTEFGKIAQLLQTVETGRTPLQENLDKMGHTLAQAAFAIVAVIVVLGLVRGQGEGESLQERFVEMLIFGVALAVAVVPEALPAVVTISLAIGVQRMVKRHALVRRLPAVETLGSTTVICSDKTGTLTKDEMTARRVYVPGQMLEVLGTGYDPQGQFVCDGRPMEPSPQLNALLRAAVLASDAHIVCSEADARWHVKGDPTEGALVVAAAKAGWQKADLDAEFPRVHEIPFTSETKRMTTLHAHAGRHVRLRQGRSGGDRGILHPAADCRRRRSAGRPRPGGAPGDRPATGRPGPPRAGRGREAPRCPGDGRTRPDLPGPGRDDRSAAARGPGGDPQVRTGRHQSHNDHRRPPPDRPGRGPGTGPAQDRPHRHGRGIGIAQRRGFPPRGRTDRSLRPRLSGPQARVVTALQQRGQIVAMTGDGVNNAPALKKADIGIAMGITGTDVTKEAAAMMLTDDNFASIVAAAEEGRAIFGNIKKYLMYLLSSNIGEIGVMAGATLAGLPLPLTAVQILYVNLATDGLPALALAVDPPADDLMRRPPRNPRRGIFTRAVVMLMLIGGIWSTIINLGLFIWARQSGRSIEEAQTMTFVSLVLVQFFKAYCFRSDRRSVLHLPLANKWLNLAILWELMLLALVVYLPFLQEPFGTYALSRVDWLIVLGLGFTVVPMLEIGKWLHRRGWLGEIN